MQLTSGAARSEQNPHFADLRFLNFFVSINVSLRQCKSNFEAGDLAFKNAGFVVDLQMSLCASKQSTESPPSIQRKTKALLSSITHCCFAAMVWPYPPSQNITNKFASKNLVFHVQHLEKSLFQVILAFLGAKLGTIFKRVGESSFCNFFLPYECLKLWAYGQGSVPVAGML